MSFASGFAAGLAAAQALHQNDLNASTYSSEQPDYTHYGNTAYQLPPGFDPPDTFEKHEAAYKRLKNLGMLPPEQKPEKSFWEWLFG